jgi:hypothetical protein
MVTTPTKQTIPPAPTGMKPAKPVDPAVPASGFAGTNVPKGPGPMTVTERPPVDFKLPEKVTPAEIKDQSFKYGGGRSAGNRSLADNNLRHEKQR